MRRITVPALALTSALLLGGCGLLGQGWDVRMEVTGPGRATVGTKFAGETDLARDPTAFADSGLPFSESRNVGFGFNDLAVRDAAPGTMCRIFLDDRPVVERAVDGQGRALCRLNNQDTG